MSDGPRHCHAHFWAAPGVEVAPNTLVRSPAPRLWRIPVLEPTRLWDACFADQSKFFEPPPIHYAEFELSREYRPGHEVAHYDLVSQPKAGWRWLIHDVGIAVEKSEPSDV